MMLEVRPALGWGGRWIWCLVCSILICQIIGKPYVLVDDEEALYGALNDDTVISIELNEDIRMCPKRWNAWPITVVKRDVVITGHWKGGEEYRRSWDHAFILSRIVLKPGVNLTIDGVEIKNADERTPLAILASSPGTSVVMKDVIYNWGACMPSEDFARLLTSSPTTGPRNEVKLLGRWCDNTPPKRCYRDALHMLGVRWSFDVADNQGGYVLELQNSVSNCETPVSKFCITQRGREICKREYDACIAMKGPPACPPVTDGCIADRGAKYCQKERLNWLHNRTMEETYDEVPGGKQRHNVVQLSVLIIVPIVVVTAACLVVFIVVRRRCSRKTAALVKDSTREDHAAELGQLPLPGPRLSDLDSAMREERDHKRMFPFAPDGIMLGARIATGELGSLHEGTFLGESVAVRIILHDRQEETCLHQEFRLAMRFNHPNVVRTLHLAKAYSDVSTPRSSVPDTPRTEVDEVETWLVQELCDLGSLARNLYERRHSLGDKPESMLHAVLSRAHEVAAGMHYLHSRNICHGDLNCDNVLLKTSPQDPFGSIAKVADFGLGRALGARALPANEHCLKIAYMAPERVLAGQIKPAGDVYSFGIMLWELYTRTKPYQGWTHLELMQRVVINGERLDFPDDAPPDYVDLAQQCWEKQPFLRPTFDVVTKRIDALIVQQGLHYAW